MRVLFVHPEDQPQSVARSSMRWDLVIDLGIGGSHTSENWERLFRCSVASIDFPCIASGSIRNALAQGLGFLVDKSGIDWWKVISMQYVQQAYRIVALQKVVGLLGAQDEVFVSRPGFDSRVLRILLDRDVACLPGKSRIQQKMAKVYLRSRQLTAKQIKQTLWDKYDSEHRLRAFLHPERAKCKNRVVLLPTAYINVTRMALAYAETLSLNDFLLVAARSSGWAQTLPANVAQADLAAYFHSNFDGEEYRELRNGWEELKKSFRSLPILSALLQGGSADRFTSDLRKWLRVRDAWANVMESEPVSEVLSCDDVNPYTHIAGLVAKQMGIRWVGSHHGALDGHYLIKECDADLLLAKGEMESDYLQQCGVPADRIEIGAPLRELPHKTARKKSSIVFFSEDYEASGGRAEDFYHDVLPPLAELAEQSGKKLVIKLHPAESQRDRRRIVRKVLSLRARQTVRLVCGPLTEELMEEIWFACTVVSSAAVDCAVRGIPAFLFGWLENWPYGYVKQFAKFGVASKLSRPEDIANIPQLLEAFRPCDPNILWRSPASHALQRMLAEEVAPVQVA